MAHVKCSNRFPSFGGFDWVSGPFWAKKKSYYGAQKAQFWEGTSRLGTPALGSFWLKTWIWQGPHLGHKMARVE